jgi:hypothetical protein
MQSDARQVLFRLENSRPWPGRISAAGHGVGIGRHVQKGQLGQNTWARPAPEPHSPYTHQWPRSMWVQINQETTQSWHMHQTA